MAEKVRIGIHIWYPGKVGSPDGMPDVENDINYVAARTQILGEGPENQVLFIVRNFYHDTRQRLGLGAEWDGHIIQTDLGTPKPSDMSFREARKKILERFPGDEYEYWGTELYLKEGPQRTPTWGCVKGAMDNLNLPNSKINVASCWVNSLPEGYDPSAGIIKLGMQALFRQARSKLFKKA